MPVFEYLECIRDYFDIKIAEGKELEDKKVYTNFHF